LSVASTFTSLHVQADNGVIVAVDLTSTSGEIYLDSDLEDSSSSDGFNSVSFEGDRTIATKEIITLEATYGNMFKQSELTLRAGTGVVIHNDMFSKSVSKVLVIDADFESAGDGTLTLSASRTVTTNSSPVIISAWDIDLSGV